MQGRKIYWIAAIIAVFALLAVAQQAQQTAPGTEKVIKHVPVKPTNAASGEEMYVNYCAVCHGKDGKGGGPAASALKVPPTDLTKLTANAGGKYPSLHVSSVIRGEADLPAHGSKDMPVWGPLFWRMSQGHEAEVQQRIANLNAYVESLQGK
jgi:mono/diheme cytochrome c family protein